MSSTQATTDYTTDDYTATRRVSTETKASFKTTELIAYVATVIGVLVAAAIADESSDFGTQEAWFYVSLLTIGYMISRGLAKSGSRDFYDDTASRTTR
jgi:hypothetical protein